MKKKILAAALALTMTAAVPMTAIAGTTDVQVGQGAAHTYINQNGAAGQPIYSDPVTCVAMVNLTTWEEHKAETEKLRGNWLVTGRKLDQEWESSLTDEYVDIFFNTKNSATGFSTLQDYRGLGTDNWWYEVDGQRVDESIIVEKDQGRYFTVTINGVTYDKCRVWGVSFGIIRVPKAASSVTLNYIPCDSMLSFDEKGWPVRTYVPHSDELYRFHLKTGATPVDTASAQPQTTGATPMWKSDARGWWLERPDGSYLVNEWYQYNGSWYYMGADGYMLTNTTTPDGYPVNADGVWVQ